MLTAVGVRSTAVAATDLAALAQPTARPASVLVIDLRGEAQFPAALPELKRAHPRTAIVLVTGALDTAMMLEAIRCGVTECVVEPVAQAELVAAVRRVSEQLEAPSAGQVFGIVGAKGGVGTTTVAVNLAVELARIAPGQTLLIDLQLSHGDAAVMLGVEPRFSVVDALENTHRLDEAVFRGLVTRTSAGVDLLASSDRWTSISTLDGVRQLIALTARLYRYVVLDLPRSGFGTIDVLGDLTRVVVVANQEILDDPPRQPPGGRPARPLRKGAGVGPHQPLRPAVGDPLPGHRAGRQGPDPARRPRVTIAWRCTPRTWGGR